MFSTFLPKLAQSTTHSSWITVLLHTADKFSNMKVHWQTWSHCLRVTKKLIVTLILSEKQLTYRKWPHIL